MRKIILFGITAMSIALVIVASCKKSSNGDQYGNWVCHCSISSTSGTYIRDIPESNQTESNANAACAQIQTSYATGTTTAACQLQQ